jgi:hypothetical protein
MSDEQFGAPYCSGTYDRETTAMSRHPRAGSAGKLVGLRVTDDERREWKRCARVAGQSLSTWLRSLANNEAREIAIRHAVAATEKE